MSQDIPKDTHAYRIQVVTDILDAKEKTNWAPLILVEWKPKRTKDEQVKERLIGGVPSGYVIMREPSCRQTELYGILKRTMPTAAAEHILAKHVVIDRIGLDKVKAAGFIYSLMDTLTRWSNNDPKTLNPMIDTERDASSPLSEFILSHLFSVNPQQPMEALDRVTYSQLLHRLFATERTLVVATGGQSQPFRLYTPEMIREEQRLAEKKRIERIFQHAEEEEAPPPPPPTEEELHVREMLRQQQKIKAAPAPDSGENRPARSPRKREFR